MRIKTFFWCEFKLFLFFCRAIKFDCQHLLLMWLPWSSANMHPKLAGSCFLVLRLHQVTLLLGVPSTTWQRPPSCKQAFRCTICSFFSLSTLQLYVSHIPSPDIACTFTAFKTSHQHEGDFADYMLYSLPLIYSSMPFLLLMSLALWKPFYCFFVCFLNEHHKNN